MDGGYNLFKLTTVFILFCVRLDAQKFESPCPSLFIYQQRDDSTDRWYGLMNLESSIDITGITLKFTLDNPAIEFGNLLGKVVTSNHKEYIVKSRNFQLIRDTPLLLRFYISYDPKKPIPKLISIEQNNELICAEDDKPFSHSFISTFVNSSNAQDVPILSDVDDNNNIQCGTIAAEASPLIVEGRIAPIRKYPWHAALFATKSDEDKTLQNDCGGSLISDQWIVTLARCVVRRSGKLVEAHLGKHYLVRKEPNVQIAEISDTVIHPDYNLIKRSHDLALVKLKEPVVINDYVRPVCLWKGDTDYESIVNKKGSVPGWGKNKLFGEVSEELKEANLSFASYQDCLKKNPQFYLTRNVYCGKSIDGAPCSGDSGGGMVFLNNSSGREVYYLRGISSYTKDCGIEGFHVFEDVATYLDFINVNIQ